MTECLLYAPGKGSTPVAARWSDPRRALAATDEFLDRYATVARLDRVVVMANDDPSLLDPRAAAEALDAARARFGAPAREGARTWIVQEDARHDATEIAMELLVRWPSDLSPLTVHLHYQFTLEGTWEAPASAPESTLGVSLFYRRRIGYFPNLVFPFAWESAEREVAVERVREDCPFPVHRTHFRRLLQSADGSRTTVRRI